MTPEERAERIRDDWTTDMGRGHVPPDGMIRDIAAAIRAAVDGERTACARIAWGMRADHHDANPEPTAGRCMCAQCELAFQIADAIRARGQAAT